MITTVTMNASLDKAYFMKETIVNGTVMRVQSARTSAGGKGLNVARAAALCGAKVQATGLTGGYNGQQLEWLLDQDGGGCAKSWCQRALHSPYFLPAPLRL